MATALATNLKLRVAQTKRLATTITKQQKKTELAHRMMNAESAVVLVFWRVHAIATGTSQNLLTTATATASPMQTVMAFAMSLNSPVAPMKEPRTMKRLRHTMMVHANMQVVRFQVLATMIHLGMYWMPMHVILIAA